MATSTGMIFSHPDTMLQLRTAYGRILPVFLPFAGCRTRCLYCASRTQTGQSDHGCMPDANAASGSPDGELAAAYDTLQRTLEQRRQTGAPPVELGFYGGTFTALPAGWSVRFLQLAGQYRTYGTVTRVRCSTRPDAVDAVLLGDLKALGLDAVELGVQTFDDAVLTTSLRGYTGESAAAACHTVHAAGLELGIQLLPGLPGHSVSMFLHDMRTACGLRPQTMRLYPCVVFRDTGLAAWYRRGDFAPWSLDDAADACADALRIAWNAGVRVIRTGLAQEPGLERHILAGPYHPAFGSMVRGRALVPVVLEQIRALGRAPVQLRAPQAVRGEFWGYKGECKAVYQAAGLTTAMVQWWDASYFALQ